MQDLELKTITPTSAEEASAMLRAAWEKNLAINIQGGGTRQYIGNFSTVKPAITLSTLKLNKLVAYEPSDLTITLQAGARWSEVKKILAERGQWIPLDIPELPDSRVGGVVATNVSGPKRLLYGTLRDLVIGCEFVLADGSLGHSGGRVVKNVTGYDLHKLLIGSLGTLGLLTEVTFKVLPLPQANRWFIARFGSYEKALETARKLARSNTSPAALELIAESATQVSLYGAADGVEVAVINQIENMVGLCKANGATEVNLVTEPAEAHATWEKLRNFPQGYGVNLRFSVLPIDLPLAWKLASRIAGQLEMSAELQARAGTGLVYLYGDLEEEQFKDAAELIERARVQLQTRGGSLVLEKAPDGLKKLVEVWGNPGGDNSLASMQTLKNSLDTKGLLNPGKFLKGL
jgi:glycolate oxidase FAD binding subunit